MLSDMLRRKKISVSEVMSEFGKRISETEPEINAYITVNNFGNSLQDIENAYAAGKELHPLAGIPIAVKDNISTKGIRTTCASKMLENYIPPFDAEIITKLKTAGAIFSGKCNMDEFAMGSTTETSFFGAVKNPVDTEYYAGGSSGGSAAAVKAGECAIALGSDTGGSVRQPASFCGCVGFRPEYGRVSRYGLIAFSSSLDQIGPIAKNVRDCAMLYSAISGYDSKDQTSLRLPPANYNELFNTDVSRLRIGIPEECFGNTVSSSVGSTVIEAAKLFEKNGAELIKIKLPSIRYAVNVYYIISSAEASSNLARFDGIRFGHRAQNCSNIQELYERSRSEGFGAEVKRRIMLGTFVLSEGHYEAYYKRAKLLQRRIINEFEEAFKNVDILLTPTYPEAGIKTGSQMSITERYASDILTVPASIAGLPALSMPCGNDTNGLPIGMQLIGAHGSDSVLFSAAELFERLVEKSEKI